jgi:hypothetical protein
MTTSYCLIWDSPSLGGKVPVFISPKNRVAQLNPLALGSLFVASYDSQGYSGGILTRLHTYMGTVVLIASRTLNAQITFPFAVLLLRGSHLCCVLPSTHQGPLCIYLSRGRCPATGLHATMIICHKWINLNAFSSGIKFQYRCMKKYLYNHAVWNGPEVLTAVAMNSTDRKSVV